MKSFIVVAILCALCSVNGQWPPAPPPGQGQPPSTGPQSVTPTPPPNNYGPIQNMANPFLMGMQGIFDGILSGTRNVFLVPVGILDETKRTMTGVMNSFTGPHYQQPQQNIWDIFSKIAQMNPNPTTPPPPGSPTAPPGYPPPGYPPAG